MEFSRIRVRAQCNDFNGWFLLYERKNRKGNFTGIDSEPLGWPEEGYGLRAILPACGNGVGSVEITAIPLSILEFVFELEGAWWAQVGDKTHGPSRRARVPSARSPEQAPAQGRAARKEVPSLYLSPRTGCLRSPPDAGRDLLGPHPPAVRQGPGGQRLAHLIPALERVCAQSLPAVHSPSQWWD